MENLTKWIFSFDFIVTLIIIGVSVLIWVVIRRSMGYFIKRSEERTGRRNTTARTVKRVIKFAIIVICVLVILQVNGVNVTSLLASLGIAGAVIGFAAQDILKDLLMGSRIVSDNFFIVGDVIKFREYTGVVTKMTLNSTQIRDIYNNNVISICNRNLDVVEVLSKQLDLKIGLSYDDDPEKIHKVMRELAVELPDTVPGIKNSIYKGTNEFKESSIEYMISVFMDPTKRPQLRRDVLMTLQRKFAAEDIRIPFPQVDVHFDEGSTPVSD